jgi:hypothetical protein
MAEPRIPWETLPESDLERALTALGGEIDYPPTPDLAPRVRARLDAISLPDRPIAARRTRRRLLWLAAAAVLLLIALTLALDPAVRTAVADRLGLGGVQMRWFEELPTPAPTPAGASLHLGRSTTLAEAEAAVEFPVGVPTLPGYEAPASVYLMDDGPGPMVSFVYPPHPGLPASDVPGVGALLTQFTGNADRGLIEKGLRGGDGELATRLETVTINGEPGFWIAGAPHAVFFICYDVGECREERYRLAGNVLLWQREGVTFRLESALSRGDAIAIAESVQPLRKFS